MLLTFVGSHTHMHTPKHLHITKNKKNELLSKARHSKDCNLVWAREMDQQIKSTCLANLGPEFQEPPWCSSKSRRPHYNTSVRRPRLSSDPDMCTVLSVHLLPIPCAHTHIHARTQKERERQEKRRKISASSIHITSN